MKKDNKNRRIVLYIIAAVTLIAALYFINNPVSVTGNVISNTTTGGIDFSRQAFPDYYSLLPPKPDDFDQLKLMLQRGIIRDDPDKITVAYWKQPEWFPRHKESFLDVLNGLSKSNRIPIWSISIYDAQIYEQINKDWMANATTIPTTQGHGVVEIKNDSIAVKNRFWVRSSVGALQVFGVGLHPTYRGEAVLVSNALWNIEGKTIKQDPETTKKYIKIYAVESSSGETEFNLGTYWPKLSPDYQKQIDVTAEIKKDIPKGVYVASIEVGSPSKEYQEKQSWSYGLTYTDPNIGMHVQPGTFDLFIEVL